MQSTDAVWKVVRPKATYPCSLCALTYGWVSMHGRWRRFLAASSRRTRCSTTAMILPRPFPGSPLPLPAILLATGDAPPQVLVSAGELDALHDLSALIALLAAAVGGSGSSLTGRRNAVFPFEPALIGLARFGGSRKPGCIRREADGPKSRP